MDQSKGAKGNNPKAWREADISRIISISFDKQKYSVNPGKIGPDGLPTMVLSGLARSSGHVPNFSRFGGRKFPVPIMPFHGGIGSGGGVKTTKAFQKPGEGGDTGFERYKDFNNALSRTFGENLKDNLVYPGQIGSNLSVGLSSLFTKGAKGAQVGDILKHPSYQKFLNKLQEEGVLKRFNPDTGSISGLLQSIVSQARKPALTTKEKELPAAQQKRILDERAQTHLNYYRSKEYSNLFEELVGLKNISLTKAEKKKSPEKRIAILKKKEAEADLISKLSLADPGFGLKGASNFMGTAGYPTVEGMMKHGGQTRFMEIKASASGDNLGRLIGKSMQMYPDKYRELARRNIDPKFPDDFKIIDDFLSGFSKKPTFASDMEKAAYKTGGSFIDSYMSGGHVPNFTRFAIGGIGTEFGAGAKAYMPPRAVEKAATLPYKPSYNPFPNPMRPNPQFQRHIKPSVTVERNMWDVQNKGWGAGYKRAIPKGQSVLDAMG